MSQFNRQHDKFSLAKFIPGVVFNVGFKEVFDSNNLANEGAGHQSVQLFDVKSLAGIHADLSVSPELDHVGLGHLHSLGTASESPFIDNLFSDNHQPLTKGRTSRESLDEFDLHFLDGFAAARVVDLVANGHILAENKVLLREDDHCVARIREHAKESTDFADKWDRNRHELHWLARLQDVNEPDGVDARELEVARIPLRPVAQIVFGRRGQISGLDEVDCVKRNVLGNKHVLDQNLGVPLVVGQDQTAWQPVRDWKHKRESLVFEADYLFAGRELGRNIDDLCHLDLT